MGYNSVAISSGHGKYVRGAAGIIDEVDEARNVVERVAKDLRKRGVEVVTFHDDVSSSQSENLNRITDWHNEQIRDVDISTHFNAYEQVEKCMGTEVLYVTQSQLAEDLSEAIAEAGGFLDRGPKKRTDLHFLNCCDEPAVLLEVCFVDSECDCLAYRDNFDEICMGIADALAGEDTDAETDVEQPIPPQPSGVVRKIGKVSWFGGPDDMGVSDDEGLAFIYSVEDAPHLFLPEGTPGTEGFGLARRLNPFVHYIACRWNYDAMSKTDLLKHVALVKNTQTGFALKAFPSDWGPHGDTDRLADISPGLMEDLGLTTDDEVEVTFPYFDDKD